MFYTVIECDQGQRIECESFDTKWQASDYIAGIYRDMIQNPSYYRHLANPCYVVEKQSD
jgi:hypothetical protein